MKKWFLIVFCAALVGLILYFVLPPYIANRQLQQLNTSSLSSLKAVALATVLYCEDNGDRFPPEFLSNEGLRESLTGYLDKDVKDKSAVFAPKNPDEAVILGNKRLAGVMKSSIADKGEAIMLFESKDWAELDGRNISYADAHVKFVKPFDDRMLEVGFEEGYE